MTKEEKAVDLLKQLAEFNEIPPGSKVNKEKVWADIQMKMEKANSSKKARWVIIALMAIIIVSTIIVVYVVINFKANETKLQKETPHQTSYINSIHQYQSL